MTVKRLMALTLVFLAIAVPAFAAITTNQENMADDIRAYRLNHGGPLPALKDKGCLMDLAQQHSASAIDTNVSHIENLWDKVWIQCFLQTPNNFRFAVAQVNVTWEDHATSPQDCVDTLERKNPDPILNPEMTLLGTGIAHNNDAVLRVCTAIFVHPFYI